jgi:hypothetical protein
MIIWAYPITDSYGTPLDVPWIIVRANNEPEAKKIVDSVMKNGEVVQAGHIVPSKAAAIWNEVLDEKDMDFSPTGGDDGTGYPICGP